MKTVALGLIIAGILGLGLTVMGQVPTPSVTDAYVKFLEANLSGSQDALAACQSELQRKNKPQATRIQQVLGDLAKAAGCAPELLDWAVSPPTCKPDPKGQP